MNDNPLLRRRWFLYVTEFCVGMCLMAVELGASRLLAPYFSSSQIVWTIIIGTIMVAMAVGNFLGGKMADKFPSVTRLYLLLMIAAVWIALIPFLGRFVIAGITGLLALFVNHGLLIWAAFLTCLLWFCPPLMVLGMVTPSLIKYSMGNKATSGKIVGILEALNTVGSILGTFLPTFVTIPTMGTALSFLLFGGILVLVSAAFFLAFFIKPKKKDGPSEPLGPEDEGKAKKAKVGVGVATALCLVLTGGTAYLDAAQSSFDFGDNSIVYRGESVYNYLQVKETKDSYLFSTNVLFSIQSMIKKDGSLTGMYYDTCLAANYMAGGTEKGNLKVLVLGMGPGPTPLCQSAICLSRWTSRASKSIRRSSTYRGSICLARIRPRSLRRRPQLSGSRRRSLRRHHGRCL
jgi:MFS family permease